MITIKHISLPFLIFSLLLIGCQAKRASSFAIDKIPSDPVRVAVVQYEIKANRDIKSFLGKMEDFVKEAAKNQSDVVIFPEYVTLDLWRLGTGLSQQKITLEIAEFVKSIYLEKMIGLAKKYNLWIIAGSYPRLYEGKLFNTSPIISPTGVVTLQDKVFLTHWERNMGFEKGKELKLVHGPWGLGVVLICYDVEFPELIDELEPATQSLGIIFVPSMAESKGGLQRILKTSSTRAIEHHAYVVVSSTVGGPTKTWQHFGKSSVFSPVYPPHPGILV